MPVEKVPDLPWRRAARAGILRPSSKARLAAAIEVCIMGCIKRAI
jgi:hypothetical protein